MKLEFSVTHPAFDIAVNRSLEWHVNGEPVAEDVKDSLRDRTAFEIENWGHPACPHCRGELTDRTFDDVAEDHEKWHNNRCYVFQRCRYCAYWEFNGAESGNRCMDPQTAVLLSSIVARFTKDFPEGCSQELAQFLRRQPSFWHEMAPRQLEKLVSDVFKANYHEAEAIHVGKPYDRGIDVVFIESHGTRWLIQVKRRERPKPSEGFSTLQSILGTLALEGTRHGIVVSTADSFSFHAQRARQQAEQQGFVVQFIDKGILNRMITPLLPRPPWKEIFRCPELVHVAEDVQRHFWADDGQMIFEGF